MSSRALIDEMAIELELQMLLLPPSRLQLGQGTAGDLAAINDELDRLQEGRRYFMDWVAEFRKQEPADRRGLSPWAFLTAWNDSTARIIYLMRERRGLGGHKETEFDPLMEAVFDQIEQQPGVEALDGANRKPPLGVGDQSAPESDRTSVPSPGKGASDQ